MSRQRKPSRQVSVDGQVQVVLAVWKGEVPLAEAARRRGVTASRCHVSDGGQLAGRFVDAGKA